MAEETHRNASLSDGPSVKARADHLSGESESILLIVRLNVSSKAFCLKETNSCVPTY